MASGRLRPRTIKNIGTAYLCWDRIGSVLVTICKISMTLRLPQVYSILRQQCVKILDADATCAFIPSESTPFASLTQGLE